VICIGAFVAGIQERLTDIVVDILRVKPEEIVDSLDMDETGTWDSLSHMQLIAAVEEEFGIELTADEIVAMRSVGEIKRVLAGRLKAP
jgi:acyl carrier protein